MILEGPFQLCIISDSVTWLRSLAALNVSPAGEMTLRTKRIVVQHHSWWVCHSGCAGALQRSWVCVHVGIGQRCLPRLRRFSWDSGDFWRAAPHLPGLKCAGMPQQRQRCVPRGARGGVAVGADKVMSGWAFGEERSQLLGNGSAAWIPSLLHLLPCKAEPSWRKWGAAS